MQKHFGINDKFLSAMSIVEYLFHENPNEKFTYTEIKNQYKTNDRTLTKVLKFMITQGSLKKQGKYYYKKYYQRTKNSPSEEILNISTKILESDIPLEDKVKILLPEYIAQAKGLFMSLLKYDTNPLSFFHYARNIYKSVLMDVMSLPDGEQDVFFKILSETIMDTNDSFEVYHNKIYQNWLDYLKEENTKKLGISKNKKSNSSHSKVSQPKKKAIKV